MTLVRSARTPLGLWQYHPGSGMNVLDTDLRGETWRPLYVSIALTGRCLKGCPFCYASSTEEGTTQWAFGVARDSAKRRMARARATDATNVAGFVAANRTKT
jgi:hypothetical protein